MATLVQPVSSLSSRDVGLFLTPLIEVVKRDGRRATWDPGRITRALALAFYAERHADAANSWADDATARYGPGVAVPVEGGALREAQDVTALADVVACAGGACELSV